ncbi:MAG: GlpM family protein [Desulfosporosinus sp.]|nr:GlpM family protein [Desulfosporosinus sp.]
MTLVELLTRFLVGGTLVVLINLIGKSRNSLIAGLAMLFPAITLLGYYFLSLSQHGSLSKTVMFSIWSLPTSLVFLLALYFTIDKIPILQALTFGIASWLITAIVIIGVYTILSK